MGISIVGTSLAESLAGYHLIFVIMTCVLGAIALVYSVGIMYQFPMMVTYELKVSQILKNSLILTATRFLPSVGWFLLVAGPLLVFIWMAFSWAWALLAMEVFYIFFGFSFMQYVNNTWTEDVYKRQLMVDAPLTYRMSSCRKYCIIACHALSIAPGYCEKGDKLV